MNVFFAGGGSGGHLYPALAIARALVAADPRVTPFFIGARRGIEREVLPRSGFEYELLDLHPLYRARPWLNWRTVAGGARGWARLATIAADTPPSVLVATGGYAAGVALGFAAHHRVPIVIQEQNSYPGLTVRWFAPRATQIHLGFPEARAFLKPGRATALFDSGNPIEPPPAVRMSVAEAKAMWGFANADRPTLLVFGGSQGSEALNRAVGMWTGTASAEAVNVIWATGPANHSSYARLDSTRVRVVPYLDPISRAYEAADLALTRAGAMTAAEFAAWGIVSVYVPLPTAAADHQTSNARAIAAAGAGVFLPQAALSPETLGATIKELIAAPDRVGAMRAAVLERARPHAAQDIAAKILTMPCFK